MKLASTKPMIRFNDRTYEKNSENIKRISRILKEKIYEMVADEIANRTTLSKKFVLHGGGALYLAYGSPRKTYDIDFSFYPSLNEKEIEVIQKEFLTINPKIERKKIKSKINKFEKDEFRVSYFFEIDKTIYPTIKVEGKKAQVLLPPNEVTIGIIGSLQVEQPKEILADKVLAIFGRMSERGSIKTTDLYDIFYLLQIFDQKIELSFIEEKIKTQNWRVSKLENWSKLYEKVLENVDKTKTKLYETLRTQLKKDYLNYFSFDKMIKTSVEFIENLVKNI